LISTAPVDASRAVSAPLMSALYTTPLATAVGLKCSGPPSADSHAGVPEVVSAHCSPAGVSGP
jgi:hypothetical protein